MPTRERFAALRPSPFAVVLHFVRQPETVGLLLDKRRNADELRDFSGEKTRQNRLGLGGVDEQCAHSWQS